MRIILLTWKKDLGSHLEVTYLITQPIHPISTQIVLDWPCQFIYFPRYETIETYARAVFMVIILSIGREVAELFLVCELESFAHFGTYTAGGPKTKSELNHFIVMSWNFLHQNWQALCLWNSKFEIMYKIVHRFNNRWRWCRFASSMFKTMRDDVHKLEFKQFYCFSRWKILFFILWVINFQYL